MQPSKSVSSASTSAPLASGWTSCAAVTFPRGSTTIAGMPAAAAYAASAADVSPVDAQPTARTLWPSAIICLTAETRTVIPRSLNEPVCELPHCLTHRSSRPISAAKTRRPEQVRAAFVHRDDVLVADRRRRPTPSCPTRPSRTATPCACSVCRRASATPRPSVRGAPACRARPRADRRTAGSGR